MSLVQKYKTRQVSQEGFLDWLSRGNIKDEPFYKPLTEKLKQVEEKSKPRNILSKGRT